MLTLAGFAKRTAAAVVLTVMLMLVVSAARAQDTLRIALFKTASEDNSLQTLASAIDPVLLSELGNVPNLQIAARPALDLPSMQLAIDCVGETEQCLALAAKQAEADGLIAPTVRKLGGEIVVTVLLHDARKQVAIKGATRRYEGDKVDDQVLDGIHGMVRELFGLDAAPAPVAAASTVPLEVSSPIDEAPPTAAAKPLPVLPIVLAASGVAFIAAGAVLGAVSKSGESDYAKFVPKDDRNDSPETNALHKYNTAHTEATLANIGFGVGAAALAAGIVVFIVQQQHGSSEQDTTQTSARLHLAVQPGRLALMGHWD